jgi:hypothetical protein
MDTRLEGGAMERESQAGIKGPAVDGGPSPQDE